MNIRSKSSQNLPVNAQWYGPFCVIIYYILAHHESSSLALHVLGCGEVCASGASNTGISSVTGIHPPFPDLPLFTRCTDTVQLLTFCCSRQPSIMLLCCKASLPWKHFQFTSNCHALGHCRDVKTWIADVCVGIRNMEYCIALGLDCLHSCSRQQSLMQVPRHHLSFCLCYGR